MDSILIFFAFTFAVLQFFLCGYFLGEQSGNKEPQNHLLKKGGIPDV